MLLLGFELSRHPFVEPREDSLQLTAAVEHAHQLDAVGNGSIDQGVPLEVVAPQVGVQPLAALPEIERGVGKHAAFPLQGIDEALGIDRAVPGDVEADLDEVGLRRGKLPDTRHETASAALPLLPLPRRGCAA